MFADMKSENGRPAGYGTVRFKHPDDAIKAIGILFCLISLLLYVIRWLLNITVRMAFV